MKTIPLTQGKVAIVDDEDYDELNQYKWYANNEHGCWYAKRNIYNSETQKQTVIRMHCQIMGFPDKDIDHINRNGLDNRRCNLRLCSDSQNLANAKIQRNNTSGFRGVTYHIGHKKWVAAIVYLQKKISLGDFDTPEEASKTRDEKALELFGEFANLNFQKMQSKEEMQKSSELQEKGGDRLG
jgi:hypothetical protein